MKACGWLHACWCNPQVMGLIHLTAGNRAECEIFSIGSVSNSSLLQ
jgi:hypothetical protein